MERSYWMYCIPRPDISFIREVENFIEAAKKHALIAGREEIFCPCVNCKNEVMWPNPNEIRGHLIKRGFIKDYTVWSFHGESSGTTSADPGGHQEASTTHMVEDGPHGTFGDNGDGVDADDDDDGFDLEAMLRHAEPEVVKGTAKGLNNYENLEKSARQLLYDESKGCDKEYTVLRSVLELLKLKASHNWSDRSFDDLLVLLAAMLPKPSLLPANTYQAKKLICPLTLGVQKIHACPNHYFHVI
ncbi:hypothetical protein ACP70R_028294 [Stipagrostis hirtigluma subsp. patula]